MYFLSILFTKQETLNFFTFMLLKEKLVFYKICCFIPAVTVTFISVLSGFYSKLWLLIKPVNRFSFQIENEKLEFRPQWFVLKLNCLFKYVRIISYKYERYQQEQN